MAFSLTKTVQEARNSDERSAREVLRALLNYCVYTNQRMEAVIGETVTLENFQRYVRDFDFAATELALRAVGFQGDITDFGSKVGTKFRLKLFEKEQFQDIHAVVSFVDNAVAHTTESPREPEAVVVEALADDKEGERRSPLDVSPAQANVSTSLSTLDGSALLADEFSAVDSDAAPDDGERPDSAANEACAGAGDVPVMSDRVRSPVDSSSIPPAVAAPFLTSAAAVSEPLTNALHQHLMDKSDFYFALQVAKTDLDLTSKDGKDRKWKYEDLQFLIAQLTFNQERTHADVYLRAMSDFLEANRNELPSAICPIADAIVALSRRYADLDTYTQKSRTFFQTLWQDERILAKNNHARNLATENRLLAIILATSTVAFAKRPFSSAGVEPSASLAHWGMWTHELSDKEHEIMNVRRAIDLISFSREGQRPFPLDQDFNEGLVGLPIPLDQLPGYQSSVAASAAGPSPAP